MSAYIYSLLLAISFFSQPKNIIEWSPSRRLTWDDFKAPPQPNTANAALTSTSINVEFGFDKERLQHSIKCTFDKNTSWVRVKSDLILGHEQGHFDIAELYARKLHKALEDYRFNPKTVSRDVNRIYEKMMAQYHKAQSRYDEETDYSRNKPKQQEWLKKIARDLDDVKDYADYNIPIQK